MIDRIHEFVALKFKTDTTEQARHRNSLLTSRKSQGANLVATRRKQFLDLFRRLSK